MDKRQIQRFRTQLEIRQQELRVTIEHQLQNARTVEPEPDAVDQAISVSEKESLLQRARKSSNCFGRSKQPLAAFEMAVSGSACPAVTKSVKHD
jgi:RNA polymerase-binding transcription factor DksA